MPNLSFLPQIHISDADFSTLPLRNFHLIIVVEPDPETWMPLEEDIDKFEHLLEMYSQLILDELFGEVDPTSIPVPFAKDVTEPLLVMVGESYVPLFFHPIAEYCDVVIAQENVDFEKMRYFLHGLVSHHPAWRAAVIGAMYEDEIIRVANAVRLSGLNTTVLTRYCISSKHFINLDDLLDEVMENRKRLLGENWEE